MKKVEFLFRKDADGTIYATAGGWTNAYTVDGEVDTSLEHHTGEVISPEEALEKLEEYGWTVCPQCGNIYPALSDCQTTFNSNTASRGSQSQRKINKQEE